MRFSLARTASFLRFAVLPAALTLAVALPIQASAQWTLKNLSSNQNDTWEGAMQASDGNFYTTSIIISRVAVPYSCQDNPANTCTYITKITPDGTATIFHTFYQVGSQNNVDGMSPNPIIEASDGNFYGSTLNGGAGGLGTIFKITPAGTFSVIFTFMPAYQNGIETSLPVWRRSGPPRRRQRRLPLRHNPVRRPGRFGLWNGLQGQQDGRNDGTA